MIKAAIFDMDGLIVETESARSKAYERVLEEYGKEPLFEESGLVHKVGIRGDDAWEIILKRHNLNGDIQELRERTREFYLDILKNTIAPMPGLLALLQFLKKKNLPIALATGAKRSIAEYILDKLSIKHYFSVLITGDEVKRGKPDPACFIQASEKLHVIPEECLVLEDAEAGITGAKSIGMKVIAVPTQFTKKQDFSKADIIVDSLKKVNWKMILSL